MKNQVVSHDIWLRARLELLAAEKAFTRERDALTRRRMAMPWERVEKTYGFEGPDGGLSLAALFDGRSQLVVYHLMFAPDWTEACKSCSFWADNFDGIAIHLAHRDVTLAAVSRAPYAKLAAYAKRMGWRFPWVSSGGSDFNFDYQASFRPEDLQAGRTSYNYVPDAELGSDMPGFSVFCKDQAGSLYHSYSTYGRGIDAVNAAYQVLDLVPKGRDEETLAFPMSWVRRHDQY